MHTKPGIKERMLADMRDSAKELMAKPKEKLDGRVRKPDWAAVFESLAGIFNILLLGCPLRHVTVHTGQRTGTRDDVPISRRSVLDEGIISAITVMLIHSSLLRK